MGGNKIKNMQASESTNNTTNLTIFQKVCYGFGHIFNDFCANFWFSYFILYMTKIAGLSHSSAGVLYMVGQFADAFATLVIGYLLDVQNNWLFKKKRYSYMLGTLCVAVCFPFIFNLILGDSARTDAEHRMLLYSIFIIMFQFGWALVQISHLALLSSVSASEKSQLNEIKAFFGVLSGVFLYGVGWAIFQMSPIVRVEKGLYEQFEELTYVTVGVGFVFSFWFFIGIKEKEPKCRNAVYRNTPKSYLTFSEGKPDRSEDNKGLNIKTVNKLSNKLFQNQHIYQIGFLYIITRLGKNTFQSYFPVFLTDVMKNKKEGIAYYPLLVSIGGIIVRASLNFFTKRIGEQITYMIGSFHLIAACTWTYFETSTKYPHLGYFRAILVGIGIATILDTASRKGLELLGLKDSPVFIFSLVNFLDKISTGIMIFTLQQVRADPTSEGNCKSCETFAQIVQLCIPSVCSLIGCLGFLVMFPFDGGSLTNVVSEVLSRRRNYIKFGHQDTYSLPVYKYYDVKDNGDCQNT